MITNLEQMSETVMKGTAAGLVLILSLQHRDVKKH